MGKHKLMLEAQVLKSINLKRTLLWSIKGCEADHFLQISGQISGQKLRLSSQSLNDQIKTFLAYFDNLHQQRDPTK